jgi:CRISPR-associated endonuclease/helicase Cas3
VAAQVVPLQGRRSAGTYTDTFHGALTAHHFRRLLEAWGASGVTRRLLEQALGGHHGWFFAPGHIRQVKSVRRDHGGPEWDAFVDDFVLRSAELLGLPDPSTQDWSKVEIGTVGGVALAGLATVSDWIASGSIDRSSHAGVDCDLGKYLVISETRAREHVVEKLGWSRWPAGHDANFRQLFEEDPRPVQQRVHSLVADAVEPGILVVEAPTGEGKTKLALHCAVTLIEQLRLGGFYVAMPTRATSNQAYEVADAMLKRLDASLSAKLLHGTAGEYLARRRAERARVESLRPGCLAEDVVENDEEQHVREWFTFTRGLLFPVAVGTIDRILKLAIRSRWAPVPLVGLSNRVIILDEVHSYELYMSTLLDRVLWWLGSLGVPVIVLSATLPRLRRDDLVRHWVAGARGGRPTDVALPSGLARYPRALWIDRNLNFSEIEAQASELNTNRKVRLTRLTDDELPGWALQQASRGDCVAIIHNLTRRVAQTRADLTRMLAALPERDRPEVIEVTGVLAHAQRAKAEEKLREICGPAGKRAGTAGLIAVGTQVLEQSLDLDFDVMASDLAPVDSLIQRLGRLRRFRRIDMDAPPVFAIVGVTESTRGPRWPSHTTRIYQDKVLLRTWMAIRDKDDLLLPDDLPSLLEAVYAEPAAEPCPPGWDARWNAASEKLTRSVQDQEWAARRMLIPSPDAENALPDLTTRPNDTRETRRTQPWKAHNGR